MTSNFLFRYYFRQTEAVQVVMLSCLFSLALVSFRVLYTGHSLFLFLVWNLFLASIPFFLSQKIADPTAPPPKWLFFCYAAVWLAFIPNAFYLITDLFHLDMNEAVPLWYDLALLLSFAWSGLLLGIISVRQMEKLFGHYFQKRFDLLFIIPVMCCNAFGVYVGRYLRFNSWDVLARPLQLAEEIVSLFIHPIRNRLDWSMIVCYSILMTLIYLTVKRLGRVL